MAACLDNKMPSVTSSNVFLLDLERIDKTRMLPRFVRTIHPPPSVIFSGASDRSPMQADMRQVQSEAVQVKPNSDQFKPRDSNSSIIHAHEALLMRMKVSVVKWCV